jgi:hypothetical protein
MTEKNITYADIVHEFYPNATDNGCVEILLETDINIWMMLTPDQIRERIREYKLSHELPEANK